MNTPVIGVAPAIGETFAAGMGCAAAIDAERHLGGVEFVDLLKSSFGGTGRVRGRRNNQAAPQAWGPPQSKLKA